MHHTRLIEDSTIAYRIEPFYFHQRFSTIKAVEGFKPFDFTKEMFYDHIDKLMFLKESDPSYDRQIVKSFEIYWNQHNKITYYDSYQKENKTFPSKDTEYVYLVEEDKDSITKEITRKRYICFKISNIQLLISETQVGFLVYDLKITDLYDEDVTSGRNQSIPHTLDSYEWSMYYLRKLQIADQGCINVFIKDPKQAENLKDYYIRRGKAIKNKLPFSEEKPKDPELIACPVKWTDLTAGILRNIRSVESFTNKEKVGHHTLLYTSTFLDLPTGMDKEGKLLKESEKTLANKAFKISHGYKETYYKETQLEDIVRPFINIMWSSSAEGVSNIVYTLPDDKAMKFFHNSFKHVRETNYYYMYILALLQKYSLIYLSISTSDLLSRSFIYNQGEFSKEDLEKELERTRDFYAKSLKFTVHGYYEQVSYHTHYNDIYEQLIKALRIPELQKELSPKMEAFHQVIETLVYEQNEKEKEEERNTKEKQTETIQTITYFLLPATLTTGILGMNIPFITNSTDFFFAYAFLLVTLITSLLSVILGKGNKGTLGKWIAITSIVLFIVVAIWDYNYDPTKITDESESKGTILMV